MNLTPKSKLCTNQRKYGREGKCMDVNYKKEINKQEQEQEQ